MAGYVKILRSIWQDDDFRPLPASAQRAYFMLISQPDLSQCGVLALTPGRWSTLAPDTTAAQIRADIGALEAANFIVVDADTEELWVRSYMKHDEGHKVPNIAKAIINAIDAIASRHIRTLAATAALALPMTLPETLTRTLGLTLSGTVGPSLYPASLDLQPSSSIPGSSGSDAEPFPASGVDDDRRLRIVDAIIDARTIKPPTNPAAHRRKCRDNFERQEGEALDVILAESPHLLEAAELDYVAAVYEGRRKLTTRKAS